MRGPLRLLVVVVIAAVLLVLWWIASGAPPPPSPPSPPNSDTTTAAAPGSVDLPPNEREDSPATAPPKDDRADLHVRVRGLVLDPDGNLAPAGVQVSLRQGRSAEPSFTALSTANGRWEFEVPFKVGDGWFVDASDPATGARAALAPVGGLRPGEPSAVIVLRLRPSVNVVGRCVTSDGEPAASARVEVTVGYAPHDGPDATKWDVITARRFVTSGADGSFELAVRPGEAIWAEALSASGEPGVRQVRRFGSDGEVLHLGDVPLPAPLTSEWHFELSDDLGALSEPAFLRVLGSDISLIRSRPGFDSQLRALRMEPTGFVLRLPLAEQPLLIAVGGPGHVSELFLLDRSEVGLRRAHLRLARRASARIRVRSGGEPAHALEPWLRLTPGGKRPARTCRDAATGAERPLPDLNPPTATNPLPAWRLLTPADGLESRLTSRVAVPLGDATYEVRSRAAGETRVTVHVGNLVVGQADVQTAHRPIDTTFDIGGGQLLLVELSPASSANADAHAWSQLPPVIALARTGRDTLDPAPVALHPPTDGSPIPLWVPYGGTHVEFGHAGSNDRSGLGAIELDDVAVQRIRLTPRADATDDWCSYGFRPTLAGEPFAAPGVEVYVRRQSPAGDATIWSLTTLTDKSGVARGRLPPGRYLVRVDTPLAVVPPDDEHVRIDVEAGRTDVRVDVPFVLQR